MFYSFSVEIDFKRQNLASMDIIFALLKSVSALKRDNVALVLTLILLIYLNFHPLEVVSHYRDPQLQVDENYSYLFN